MPDVSAMFGSYLKAAHLEGDTNVTVLSVIQEEFNGNDGAPERKWVLRFHETELKMVLNKTNAMMIASIHGSNTDAWPGKHITLFKEKVNAFNQIVEAIGVRPQAPSPPAPQAQPEAPQQQ